MNAIFFIFCTLSIIVSAIFSPDEVLPAMLGGTEKAILLSITLLSVYSLWLGVFKIAELSGLTQKLAKALRPIIKPLFGKTSKKTEEYIALNLSTNLLGMSGLATPLGIAACENLEKENNFSGAQTLFVIAATSIQILPSSVMSLMASFNSENPSRIILPSLLSTALSTALGIIFIKYIKLKPFKTKRKKSNEKSIKTKKAEAKA